MGKGSLVSFFRFHSQKPTSKRRFSKCVSSDYSCFDYHCRWTIQEDRTLCLVRALRKYLDRSKDLRGSRSLLFISFKKGHTSDIRPTTLSSWLKQLSYFVTNKQTNKPWTWSKLKRMTCGPLQPLRPFTVGFLVDQIMQACHLKAHNIFQIFYLKDLTWSDNDRNMSLGPVVAVQQLLDPSPQTSHPQKQKKRGGGGGGGGKHIHCSQVFRSLNPRV